MQRLKSAKGNAFSLRLRHAHVDDWRGDQAMRVKMGAPSRVGCAILFVAGILYFFVQFIAAKFIAGGKGFEVGNRRRMVSVAKLEMLMVPFSLLAYYKLDSFFHALQLQPSLLPLHAAVDRPTATDANSRAYQTFLSSHIRSPNSQLCSLLPKVATIAWLALSHLTYVIYFFPSFDSSLLFYMSQFSLGVWTYFVVILFLFTLLSFFFSQCKALFIASPKCGLLRSRLLNFICCDANIHMIITFCLTFFFSFATFISSDSVIVKDLIVHVRNLPIEAAGIRFALISDIHAGSTVGAHQIERVVAAVNGRNVDAVFFVGDAVDAPLNAINHRVMGLSKFRSKFGTYFVSGNHEYYYGNAVEWFDFFSQLGIEVLSNSHVNISGLCVAGVNDYSSGRSGIPNHYFDAVTALRGCSQSSPVIVLSHNPAAAKEIAFNPENLRVDLILSGHTHAGQFYTVAPFVYWVLPYFYGLYDVSNETKLFVSAGTLYQGPPMKMIGLSEIWIVSLLPSKG